MTSEKKVPDILLEMLAAGDLPEDQAMEVRQRLEKEPGGLARLAELEESNQEILEDYPARTMAAAIRERNESRAEAKRKKGWFPIPALATSAAAIFAIVFVFALLPFIQNSNHTVMTERPKGDDRILIHQNTSDGAKELFDGDHARAGDVIQLSYLAVKATHGVIVSVDGNGNATLHFPKNPGGSTLLEKGGQVFLPFAYELDDAPAFEKFFFVTSAGQIDAGKVLAAAKQLGNNPHKKLNLPSELTQTVLMLIKETGSK